MASRTADIRVGRKNCKIRGSWPVTYRDKTPDGALWARGCMRG